MLTLITTLEPGPITDKPTTVRLNYPFTSFMKVGNNYYGTSEDGLFRAGGDTDNGDGIHASFTLPDTNMGIDDEKRTRELYTWAILEGDMLVTAQADKHESRKATRKIRTPDESGLHRVKTKMGERNRGTWWTFTYENVDGAFFSIKKIALLPTVINQGYDDY